MKYFTFLLLLAVISIVGCNSSQKDKNETREKQTTMTMTTSVTGDDIRISLEGLGKAIIDWGDGTAATPGIVVRVGTTDVFNVVGSHAYAKKATYKIKVTMTDSGGSISYANSTARFLPRSLSY